MSNILGAFIAVDGPKGVGKTTALAQASASLSSDDLTVCFTKEPTQSFRLGDEQSYHGYKLAEMLALDRRDHLTHTIIPELAKCDVVVTDRYVASSLVFQALDGVSWKDIWELNKHFRLPDLNIFIVADPESLMRRRALRASQTRLERANPREEVRLYCDARAFMEAQGVDTLLVDNSDGESGAVQMIVQAIKSCVRVRNV